MIEKFIVSRDDSVYHAWPDVVLTPSGGLVCVFTQCTHHVDHSYTRIAMCKSTDRGRTWSGKRYITEGTLGKPYFHNASRIMLLRSGRLVMVVDKGERLRLSV